MDLNSSPHTHAHTHRVPATHTELLRRAQQIRACQAAVLCEAPPLFLHTSNQTLHSARAYSSVRRVELSFNDQQWSAGHLAYEYEPPWRLLADGVLRPYSREPPLVDAEEEGAPGGGGEAATALFKTSTQPQEGWEKP